MHTTHAIVGTLKINDDLYVLGTGQKGAVGTQPAKGVDVDGEGTVNGINLYEFSLDTLRDEDKPWRKPGKVDCCSLMKLKDTVIEYSDWNYLSSTILIT